MSRDLSAYDSAELSLVAHNLGLSHPLGQPLHAMVGWFFAHLPGVPSLLGLNLLSALCGALCVLPVWAIAAKMAGPEGWRQLGIAAHVLILAAAVHGALWDPSSRVEVYSMATFLCLWGMAMLLTTQNGRWERVISGLLLGLSACTNLVIATIGAVSLLSTILRRGLSKGSLRRDLMGWTAGGLIGLVPYFYVPLIAQRDPTTFLWGRPKDLGALRFFLSGADYRHNQQTTLEQFGSHLSTWFQWSFFSGVLPYLAVGVGAFFLLGARSKMGRATALLSAGLSVAFVSFNTVFDPDIPDYLGYLMAPMWLAMAATIAAIARWSTGPQRYRVYSALLGTTILAGAALFPTPLTTRTRHADRLLRRMAQGALDESPRDAIAIVSSDHWVAPLWYLQEAEGVRKDVVILPAGLTSSGWYWEHLFARHPSLERIDVRAYSTRQARVSGLLQANPQRPILFESSNQARQFGRQPCSMGWLLLAGPICDATTLVPQDASRALREELDNQVGDSKDPEGIAAHVGMTRAVGLWRMGHPATAFDALTAGIPKDLLPASMPDRARLAALPPLRQDLPPFERSAPIGDPSRNLFVAGRMLAASQQPALATEYLDQAANLGLPEAIRWVRSEPGH
jgi:hypothetical protein